MSNEERMLSLKQVLKQAKSKNKIIVFPEAMFSDRVIKVASYLNKKKIAKVVLVGDESALVLRYKNLAGMTIINPKTSDIKTDLANLLYAKRKNKGMTLEQAKVEIQDPICFGALLVESGVADCMVAGAETSSRKVIKAALQIIGPKEKNGIVSSCMMLQGKNKMMPKGGVLFLADIALNIDPSFEDIVEISKQTANTAKTICNLDSKVALLSYSTNGSAGGESAEKMAKAAATLKQTSNFVVDGEMQLDSALIPDVCKLKYPESKVPGNANVLVFPDLSSGNIAYKCIENFGDLQAVGPILQGLNKPVNDVSRSASVEDILFTSALTLLM